MKTIFKKSIHKVLTFVLTVLMMGTMMPFTAMAKLETHEDRELNVILVYDDGDYENLGKYTYTCADTTTHSGYTHSYTYDTLRDIVSWASGEMKSGYEITTYKSQSSWSATYPTGSLPYSWQNGKISTNTSYYLILGAKSTVKIYEHELNYNGNAIGVTNIPTKATYTVTEDPYKATISGSIPERAGFKFTGWAENSTIYQPGDTISISGSSTLYAQWIEKEKTKYKVTYIDGVPEDVFDDQIYTVEEGAATPMFKVGDKVQDPTRDGYTFNGWSPAVTATVGYATIYTAQWKENCTVTFDSNADGDTVSGTPEPVIVPKGDNITIPSSNLTRDGYIFDGWYADVKGGDDLSRSDYTVIEDTTLYAHWTKIPAKTYEYHINYYHNYTNPDDSDDLFWHCHGEDVTNTEDTTYKTTAKPYSILTARTGTECVEWNTKPDGSGDAYQPRDSINLTSDNHTINLYAKWTKKATFEVTYKPNTTDLVTNMPSGDSDYEGETITVKTEIPSRSGYTFDGWYTEATEGTKVEAGTEYTTSVTLYAHWTQIETHSVKFYNGEILISEVTVELHSGALKPEDPTKEGYTFDGWDKDFSDITDDLVVNAKFIVHKYEVIFDANGGTGDMNNQEFTFDEAQDLSANLFENENFIFMGWNQDASSKTVTFKDKENVSNLTSDADGKVNLYAVWQAKDTEVQPDPSEKPTVTPTVTPTPSASNSPTTTTSTTSSDAPLTGDTSNMMIWMIVLVASLVGITTFGLKLKK